MSLPVRLKDVVDELDAPLRGWQAFVHRTTGQVVGFSEEDEGVAEWDAADVPAWQVEVLEMIRAVHASDDYVRLPDREAFDEYGVMEAFCYQQEGPGVQAELLDAIRGCGAFSRFKDLIRVRGLDQEWYAHRDEALREWVADFLGEEGIPFVDE
ncbi:UPF0158 family protein [Thioalkalivibrio sp. AKL6]|uniref:UPF0158 family protein n=1 Tax=Thioalkalivibrio sp. AKL6 TaxID=1158154 RepID=UPI0003A2EF6D|nr:UPF0158 family protein [Thioalkalivibrio sp. AKL6]